MTIRFSSSICLIAALCASCTQVSQEEPMAMTDSTASNEPNPADEPNEIDQPNQEQETEVATFGAGCFWCVEAVFQEVDGVLSVESGYSGGAVDNPSYEQVCMGTTGHAEVCQIMFDPAIVSYDELLEVFWMTHDPTTLNRQGADQGTQYRSAVFYHDQRQKELAEGYKQKLEDSGAWQDPIVTEVTPLDKYFPADNGHQNYFRLNPNRQYCQFVIQPKLEKFRKVFKEKLKTTE